jgi:Flp pilus assembly protein TadD/uncharacterized protein (AIM24 family)
MPDPNEKRSKEERTTERRLVAAASAASAPHEESGEDFLFHLYRGGELLQDNRLDEAREELERALSLQPRDAKAQDLLAVVYFRTGRYAAAIEIYEHLKHGSPRDPSLKVNLALCYLRTGKAAAARTELEDVVCLAPTHTRAWGYLGLAHERLGELDKALGAFERGGHDAMARRIERALAATRLAPGAGQDAELRGLASAAYEELDAGAIDFALAAPSTPAADATDLESGTWKAVELGEVRASPAPAVASSGDGWTVPPAPREAREVRAVREPRAAVVPLRAEPPGMSSLPPRDAAAASARGLSSLAEIARGSLLIFPRASGVSLHPSGVALVKTTRAEGGGAGHSFAARLESVRAHSSAVTADVLQRQARGKSSGESFGGLGSPVVRLSGAGEIVLGPRPSHTLAAFTLHDDTIFVREEVLLGFELQLQYDNTRLALAGAEEDATPIVQLRGTGGVLLELMEPMVAVEVLESRGVVARHEMVIGWTAGVTPRPLTVADAPTGQETQRGLVSFTGDGSVLLSAR